MERFHEDIISAINFGESATILAFRDDGLYEIFEEIITNSEISTKFQRNTEEDIVIRKLGISLLEHMYENESNKHIYSSLGLKFREQTSIMDELSQGKDVIFIVEDLDQTKSPANTIRVFDKLIKQYRGQLLFIYLLQDVETFIELQDHLESNSSFFENTFYLPLESDHEKEYLESLCAEKYGKTKSKKLKEDAFKQSNGHYELYKRLYKAGVTGNKASLDKYVTRLVRDLGERTLRTFFKVVNEIELNGKEEVILSEYKKIGLISGNDIAIPALKEKILQLVPKEEITYKSESKQISFPSMHEFTRNEISVLKFLYQNIGQLSTKEEIGRVIWSAEEFQNKYSDWAIDQTMFRLRKKLEQFNVDAIVETVHGKGYILR
jgi:hypothetical protein